MPKLCLISITPSHYRKRIYQLIEENYSASFIFGKDSSSSVKRLDLAAFKNAKDIENKKIGNTKWYYQPSLISKTKGYNIIIDDLGAFCLSSWLLHVVKFFRNQKVYCWDHGWYGRENFVRKWMKRLYFGMVDGTFVYGNYARELMIKNGFNGTKLHVIHNSLDYDNQLAIRNQLNKTDIYKAHFKNDNPIIIFIGRLTPVKKLDHLLTALKILKEQGEFYNLVYVGDGEDREGLESRVDSLKLREQVWFYGACYDEKTNAELIYNADLCVAPGNIGLTAMHAMMFGCPCMSHNDFPWQMPEFESIKEWKTGAFFNRDNVESLSNAIKEWFRLNVSLREEIRNNCYREIDENWNPHKQIEIIKSTIHE